MKNEFTEWEKLFANDMTGKGFNSKIYEKLVQLKKKKQKTQLKNQQRHFPKEDIQITSRHM